MADKNNLSIANARYIFAYTVACNLPEWVMEGKTDDELIDIANKVIDKSNFNVEEITDALINDHRGYINTELDIEYLKDVGGNLYHSLPDISKETLTNYIIRLLKNNPTILGEYSSDE